MTEKRKKPAIASAAQILTRGLALPPDKAKREKVALSAERMELLEAARSLVEAIISGAPIPEGAQAALKLYQRSRKRRSRKLAIQMTVELVSAAGFRRSMAPAGFAEGAFEKAAELMRRDYGVNLSPEQIRKVFYEDTPHRPRLPKIKKRRQ